MKIEDIGIINPNLFSRCLAMPLELEMSGDFRIFVIEVAVVSESQLRGTR